MHVLKDKVQHGSDRLECIYRVLHCFRDEK